MRVLTAGAPFSRLRHQLLQSLLGTLAAFDHKTNFGFKPPHFGAGLVQSALRLVDLIARRVMRLADGFQVGFDMAQIGHARLQVVHRFVHIGLHAALVGFCIATF